MGSRVQADGPTFLGGDPTGGVGQSSQSWAVAEAERLLRQDRQPIWTSSQKFQDVRKRLKLSQQFMEAEKARQEVDPAASLLMPDQLNGKVLTATLKNGLAICPEFQTDECPNPADDCPFGVHLCAILQKSGRACCLQHQEGSCGGLVITSCPQTFGYPGARSLG